MAIDTVTWDTQFLLPTVTLPATLVLGADPTVVVELNNGSLAPAAGQEGFVVATLTARTKVIISGVLYQRYTLSVDDVQLVGGGPLLSADILGAFVVDTREKEALWLEGLNLGTLVAVGATQGTAAAVVAKTTVVTGADGAVGVILRATPAVGDTYVLINSSASALLVYPGTGDTIGAGAANASVSLAAHTITTFKALSASAWDGGEAAAA